MMSFHQAKEKAQFHINKIKEYYKSNNGTQSMIDCEHIIIQDLISKFNLPLKRDGWNDSYIWI